MRHLPPILGRRILMLQVTDAAVSIFKEALQPEDGSPNGQTPPRAIRLEASFAQDGQQAITIKAVEGPQAGDTPTEASDLQVFVAPELAAPLDSAVLDARVTPEG